MQDTWTDWRTLENIPNPSVDKTWIAQIHSYSPHCFHLQSSPNGDGRGRISENPSSMPPPALCNPGSPLPLDVDPKSSFTSFLDCQSANPIMLT